MKRSKFLDKVAFAFTVNPVVAILGPRQCGKTTLSRQFLEREKSFPRENYFDLEDSRDRERLKDVKLVLSSLKGLIVIDEVQMMPELFCQLRVLVDDASLDQRYLILGSASRDLLRQSSETLAGRISYLELTPFTSVESDCDMERLWARGGYPRSLLAASEEVSVAWRRGYIKTYLEMDIPNLGIAIPSENLRRFWYILANMHGCMFNAQEIGRSLGLSDKTVKRYLDILLATFMVRLLKPWHANLKKRQVKSPKVYMRDSGIFHTLIGVENRSSLLIHPKLGASWEGFALEEIIRFHEAESEECYFWGVHGRAGLDLLIVKDGKKYGFEIKYSSSPKLTQSMRSVKSDLELDSLVVIYPGDVDYLLSEDIRVVGLQNYLGR